MSKQILYTTDHDGESIAAGALIELLEAHQLPELTNKLNEVQPDDRQIIGWQEGDYGDCWYKASRKPEVDENGEADFDGMKCSVRNPGTHPGGKRWWIDPADPVLVPVYEEDES